MDYAAARKNMVDCQLRTNKVTDAALLAAFSQTPREAFVPDGKRGFAYVDEDLEVATGRFMIEPMILARLLQAAEIEASDVVLDVASGLGYSSAILARLADTVVGLESDSAMVVDGNRVLSELEIDNAVLVEGEVAAGYPKQAPYNVIVIAGAVAEVPPVIADQLAEGGRLVTVLREGRGLGQASLFRRSGAALGHRRLFDAATPPLPSMSRAPSFAF